VRPPPFSEVTMGKKQLSVEKKFAALTLAKESGSVAFACFSAGISRSLFYKIKRAYEREGEAGLQPKPRRAPRMPNAFSEAMVARILEETRNFPAHSYERIAARLRTLGLAVSGSGVYKVWKRHGLTRREKRLS
jgi:transposase